MQGTTVPANDTSIFETPLESFPRGTLISLFVLDEGDHVPGNGLTWVESRCSSSHFQRLLSIALCNEQRAICELTRFTSLLWRRLGGLDGFDSLDLTSVGFLDLTSVGFLYLAGIGRFFHPRLDLLFDPGLDPGLHTRLGYSPLVNSRIRAGCRGLDRLDMIRVILGAWRHSIAIILVAGVLLVGSCDQRVAFELA